MNKSEKIKEYSNKSFEDIKHMDENGIEYWYARELQLVLDYKEWRKFEGVVRRAMKACENSDINALDHFVGADKMVQIGSGAERMQKDYKLTRYACYLIAQNGDSRKEVIALAKKYGADVEAEIGCVGGSEDGSEDIAVNCTKPEDAVRFENETGVDALAIAIGNAHGNYKSTPKLRFDILEQVEKNTELPLVLHGGTGITPDDFVRCSHTGIKKINIATATFDSVEHTVKDAYKNDKISGYYDLQAAEVDGAYQNAKRHILIFGTDNKA